MNKGNMDLKTFLKQEMNKVKETNKVNHFQPNKIIKKKKFSLNEKLKPFFKFLNGLKNKLFGSLIKWNKERIKLKEEVRLAKEVKRDFQNNFTNFRQLKDKERWRVLRKFGQFYELEKEFVKELNLKQKKYKELNI